jgi:hypothetical protein
VQRLAWVLPEACLQTANWIDFPRDPTDADLAQLAGIPALQTLDIRRTSTTAAGRERFKAARPSCRVEED